MFYLGLDDYLPAPGGANPGTIVQPAAWAVGELTSATGREFLIAVIVGYDVIGKIRGSVYGTTLAVPRNLKYVVAPFGAAATASRLFGLSYQETVHALGHAGQMAMGVKEGGGHLPPMHAAVISSLASLGDEFEIVRASGRRYPASSLNAIPIRLAKRSSSDSKLDTHSSMHVSR